MDTQTGKIPMSIENHKNMPNIETLIEWERAGEMQATDGCHVESDGICPHGYKSWMLVLGYI